MDDVEHGRGLADRAVLALRLAPDDGLERTTHADEQDLVVAQPRREVGQPARLEEDVVHDHGQARVGEPGDHPVHPVHKPVPRSPVTIRNGACEPGSAGT